MTFCREENHFSIHKIIPSVFMFFLPSPLNPASLGCHVHNLLPQEMKAVYFVGMLVCFFNKIFLRVPWSETFPKTTLVWNERACYQRESLLSSRSLLILKFCSFSIISPASRVNLQVDMFVKVGIMEHSHDSSKIGKGSMNGSGDSWLIIEWRAKMFAGELQNRSWDTVILKVEHAFK